MKVLCHHRLEKEIPFSNEKITNLVVENPSLLRDFFDQLLFPEDHEESGFRFLDDDAPKDLGKNVFFLRDCYDPEIDDKKVQTFLQKDLSTRLDDERRSRFQEILNELQLFLQDCTIDYPIPVSIDTETSIPTLLKAFGLIPIQKGDSFLETFLLKIRLLSFLNKKQLFVFHGLKDFLTKEEYLLFTKEMERLEISFFLLDSHRPLYFLPHERLVRIDSDNYEQVVESPADFS